MQDQFTITIYTEDKIGLLSRVSSIFTRRHINIESITASESATEGVHRYTIVIREDEDLVKKVVKQLEKQVEVVKAFYYTNDELVYQEMALYKVHPVSPASEKSVEKIIRAHHARILAIESDFIIIEKTGYEEETHQLFNELKPLGLLEYVSSGRVAITKPMKEFKEYLSEVDEHPRL